MFKQIAIFPIRAYQWLVRPLFPSTCVFHHQGKLGCSEYTIAAIRKKGVVQGVFLGFHRITRCHPWQKNFDDPDF